MHGDNPGFAGAKGYGVKKGNLLDNTLRGYGKK